MSTPTNLLYQHDGSLTSHQTSISTIQTFDDLPESDRSLFQKLVKPSSTKHVLTVPSTIFYAQGGGQPSDIGKITKQLTRDADNNSADVSKQGFEVQSVRHAVSRHGIVLHFGSFLDPTFVFSVGTSVKEDIDSDRRNLHSRIHTAGHILGLAIRLVQRDYPDFPQNLSEGRAQHYPDASSVEFHGLIDSKWIEKLEIASNEIVQGDCPVTVEWWDGPKTVGTCPYVHGIEEMSEAVWKGGEGEKLRIIDIKHPEVAGAYPCGGTHVSRTKQCGKIIIRKISRSKGFSRISYAIE